VQEQDVELKRIKTALGGAADDRDVGFRSLVGASPKMDELRAFLAKASPSELPVLIYGESGVGKELVCALPA